MLKTDQPDSLCLLKDMLQARDDQYKWTITLELTVRFTITMEPKRSMLQTLKTLSTGRERSSVSEYFDITIFYELQTS